MTFYRPDNKPGADLFSEIVVDSFAGGGGASMGIEDALGRSVDIAINHDPEAVALHRVNHPHTRHYCENVFDVDPVEATADRRVGLLWASPDCKHFSKAKGGKPVSKRVRGLAWVVVKWAKAVRPRVIMLENVEEFQTWGPLTDEGMPCPKRKGDTFRGWKRQLRELGYAVEHRELRACDYGAPTIRKRLFLIARCDGQPIIWPEVTHGLVLQSDWGAIDGIGRTNTARSQQADESRGNHDRSKAARARRLSSGVDGGGSNAGRKGCWLNNIYSVQEVPQATEWGEVLCLMIARHDKQPIRSWPDLQRIKDELIGCDRVAVEVYPAAADVVDQAPMSHLWVLPAEFALPFGLHSAKWNPSEAQP